MRISGIFVFVALSLIFEGACAWWAAAARGIEPIILSFGAAFTAIGLNDQHSDDAKHFNMKGWFQNNFASKAKPRPKNPYMPNDPMPLSQEDIDKIHQEVEDIYQGVKDDEKYHSEKIREQMNKELKEKDLKK